MWLFGMRTSQVNRASAPLEAHHVLAKHSSISDVVHGIKSYRDAGIW